MSKLSMRLPDDNEKIQLLVGVISGSKNLILMAGGKDNLKREFYLAYRDMPKVQPFVAQIGWTHNLSTEVATLATTIKKNFEELGV